MIAKDLIKIAKDLLAKESRIDILRRIVERHQYEKIDAVQTRRQGEEQKEHQANDFPRGTQRITSN